MNTASINGVVTYGNCVYADGEILSLVGVDAGAYGDGWCWGERTFAHTPEADEDDLEITIGDTTKTFKGERGLNEALDYIAQNIEAFQ